MASKKRASGTGTKRKPVLPPPALPAKVLAIARHIEAAMVELSDATDADGEQWRNWTKQTHTLRAAQRHWLSQSDFRALQCVLGDIWGALKGVESFAQVLPYLEASARSKRSRRDRFSYAHRLCEAARDEWFSTRDTAKRGRIGFILAKELTMNDPAEFQALTAPDVRAILQQAKRATPPSKLLADIAKVCGAWDGVTVREINEGRRTPRLGRKAKKR